MYIVVGLGNPGKEYEGTRHNAGRLAVEFLSSNGASQDGQIKLATLDTFMNNSGGGVERVIRSASQDAEKKIRSNDLVVIYDDLDLPIGSMKISFDRGSGGHKGIDSIIRTLGTKEFIRIRIGISPLNIFGKMKKPQGETKVHNFVLGKFNNREKEILEGVFQKVKQAVEIISNEGLESAMTKMNG
jgi:PTH1 family peptidyl-tRNA hydrolase